VTFGQHRDRPLAAEPHATAERRVELEREAHRLTREPAPYTDVTVSFSKAISVLHASIRENGRRARLAGDDGTASVWDQRHRVFQEVLQAANRAAVQYAVRWAGVVRTSYEGRRSGNRAVVSAWPCPDSHDYSTFGVCHVLPGRAIWPAIQLLSFAREKQERHEVGDVCLLPRTRPDLGRRRVSPRISRSRTSPGLEMIRNGAAAGRRWLLSARLTGRV
jgi:hypothetical protein